jgi:hypothetical protein
MITRLPSWSRSAMLAGFLEDDDRHAQLDVVAALAVAVGAAAVLAAFGEEGALEAEVDQGVEVAVGDGRRRRPCRRRRRPGRPSGCIFRGGRWRRRYRRRRR